MGLKRRGHEGTEDSITVKTPMVKTRKLEEPETSSEERKGNAFDPIVVVSPRTETRYLFPP
jgi:hypothetical protein